MERRRELAEQTRRWVQEEADKYYSGDFMAAVAGIVEAAHASELKPDQPWAYLEARQWHRTGGKR